MKLKAELEFTIEKMRSILPQIEEYAPKLKASGKYKDFETRLAWDCLRVAVGSEAICQWYEKYNCTDKHIDTLAKVALKAVYPAISNK